MRLKVKDVDISVPGMYIAVLHMEEAEHLDIFASDRIRISKGKKSIVAIVDISESRKGIGPGEIGLFEEVLDYLDVKNGDSVNIEVERKPESIAHIKKKLKGMELNKHELDEIVRDIVANRLSDIERTYFVSACYIHELSLQETVNLTNSVVEHGGKLDFKKKYVLDKHCLGGLPGNRTTMVIIPIVAAAGYTIAKTSSRSITSPSGTSDTMEVLAKVEFSIKKIKEIVKKTNGCMVWGGTLDLASADDRLIRVEKPLSIDPEGIMVTSILSKKKADGATHVLIDIPVGKSAKIQNEKRALRLKKKFIEVGKRLGMKIKVIVTDGNQPIGRGIGPALEARDVLAVLQGGGPEDLKEKSVYMAGLLLEMAGVKEGLKKAREILESGEAYKKMKEIIKAQEGRPEIKIEDIKLGKYKHEVVTKKSGKVKHIDNELIAKIARVAGAPQDKMSGVYMNVRLKDKVKRGDVLYTIYAKSKRKLEFAQDIVSSSGVIEVK